MNMDLIKINDRLLDATQFVREGTRLADVGTDHAYLPIYLMQTGKIRAAVATDINCGPIDIASKNIAEHGYSENISTVLCDGLSHVLPSEADDIAILGMGGELIAKIIENTPWLRSADKRLILQPMTHPERLRAYLFASGFRTVGESITEDRGRIYQTLCVEFDGAVRQCGALALNFGKLLLARGDELTIKQMENMRTQLVRRLENMPSESESAISDNKLLNEINTYLEEHKNERK